MITAEQYEAIQAAFTAASACTEKPDVFVDCSNGNQYRLNKATGKYECEGVSAVWLKANEIETKEDTP